MPEIPAQPRSKSLETAVVAVLLATGTGIYFLIRQYTDWTPTTAVLTSLLVAPFALFGLAFAYFKLRLFFLVRSGGAKRALDEATAEFAVDEKELGLDKETKAFAEKTAQELNRQLRELDTSPRYMKASDGERQKIVEELTAKHLEETKARVHEQATRAAGRVAALREYRALEQRAHGGERLSEEDKARMASLKRKAYSG
jgi:hypothetical protein